MNKPHIYILAENARHADEVAREYFGERIGDRLHFVSRARMLLGLRDINVMFTPRFWLRSDVEEILWNLQACGYTNCTPTVKQRFKYE